MPLQLSKDLFWCISQRQRQSRLRWPVRYNYEQHNHCTPHICVVSNLLNTIFARLETAHIDLSPDEGKISLRAPAPVLELQDARGKPVSPSGLP